MPMLVKKILNYFNFTKSWTYLFCTNSQKSFILNIHTSVAQAKNSTVQRCSLNTNLRVINKSINNISGIIPELYLQIFATVFYCFVGNDSRSFQNKKQWNKLERFGKIRRKQQEYLGIKSWNNSEYIVYSLGQRDLQTIFSN